MNIIRPFFSSHRASTQIPDAPYILTSPEKAPVPVLFNSPHSGTYYPASFCRQLKTPLTVLRHSEDSFVDKLFIDAPQTGAYLLCNTYSRNYVDTNRAIAELDWDMIQSPTPPFPPLDSTKVSQGYGVIPRLAYNGQDIYLHKLQRQLE